MYGEVIRLPANDDGKGPVRGNDIAEDARLLGLDDFSKRGDRRLRCVPFGFQLLLDLLRQLGNVLVLVLEPKYLLRNQILSKKWNTALKGSKGNRSRSDGLL